MEIYVYGTGCGAGELTREALSPARIAAFVETEPTRETFLGRPVISASALSERQIDLLIVTAKNAPDLPLPAEKVLYLKNHLELHDRNDSYNAARKALGDAFVEKLKRQEVLVRAPLWDDGAFAAPGDWVRLKTLQTISRELIDVPGAMAELGCRLTPEQIYSINNTSLKDAIVHFGGGCTGEMISNQGLVITNHHCGYSNIQALSTPEHNYLEDGYWAMSLKEELPARGLSVTFLQSLRSSATSERRVTTPEPSP